jgi:hypothetical protein
MVAKAPLVGEASGDEQVTHGGTMSCSELQGVAPDWTGINAWLQLAQ